MFPIVGIGILGYRIAKNCATLARVVSAATESKDSTEPAPEAPKAEPTAHVADTAIKMTQSALKKVDSFFDWIGKKVDGDSHINESIGKFFAPSDNQPKPKRLTKWGIAAGIAGFAAASTLVVMVPPVGACALGFMIARDSIKLANIHTQTLTEALVKKTDRSPSTQTASSDSNQKSLVKQALRAQDALKNKESYIQARSAKEREAREQAVAAAKAAGKPLSADEVMALRNKEGKKRQEAYKKFKQKNQGR
jgi:hypothetical protein